jgi:transposase
MARHRSHSIEFKRQVAQEFIAGETLHALIRVVGASAALPAG